ncbi:protein translocase subunit SecF [bacterium]|nr:protein translocase subunit SecF [bacterium]MCI0605072.1 protein translocase subunit SecF [bacterium]
MEIFHDTKIDFLKYRTPAMLVSLVIILAGVFMIWKNGIRYGVDFSGGTAIHLKFRTVVPLDSIRNTLKGNGFPDSGVQAFNDPTQVMVRLPQTRVTEEETEELAERVATLLSANALKTLAPQGKRDLNSATPNDINGYLQLKDPWKVGDPAKYKGEVTKIRQMRDANAGLLPSFEQMRGIDAKVLASLKESFYVGDLAILSNEYVGPQVGAELREQAKLAIAWSLAGLLIYVWFRFEFLWGLSAIACLAHDVLITLAFFAFSGREISLTVVAAFLTIVGFSLNDTIVIYDRVRDNLKSMRTQPLENVINLSLNQMLNRTILTNGTVTIVTIVLFLFGGEVINDFAFAMLVGCISGTYSTVYIASAIIVLYNRYFGKKRMATVKAKAAKV